MKKIGIFHFLVLLTYVGLQAQQPSPSRQINIDVSRIKVKDLLDEISRQAGVDFSFNSKVVDTEKIISFSIKNANLKQTLDQLGQKIQVSYTIIDGQVVLNVAPKKAQYFTLSGFLADESSGEQLIGGTVYVKGTSIGTFTNEFGYYSLSLKEGRYDILYSHLGYEKMETAIVLDKPLQKKISLPPVSFELPTVVIAPPLEDILNKKQLGEMGLASNDLKNMPEFAGEQGIVNGLQSLPGIKTHGDGSAYFYARGGERDQNIIFIDDAPIFNPSHLFGFYSIFVPDFTKSIDVYKSDMPANMGDRLSSIVSIRTKDGNLNKLQFSGSINPFVYRLSLEAPIKKKKSSIFVSLRRSNFEWIYKRRNPELDINFGDFQLKWNRKFNDKNRLYLTTIISSDLLQSANQGIRTGVSWTNFAATLRWNHIFSPKLFSNTTLYTGSYANRLFIDPNYWNSGLGTLSLKSDFTHYARPDFQSKFGFELQAYFNDPGSISLDSSLAVLPSLLPNYARKSVLYYQGEWELNKKLKLKAGVRMINWANAGPASYFTYDDQYKVQDTLYHGKGVYHKQFDIDPRFSLQYKINESSQLKLSYGRYHQYLQLISNSISPFTTLELWLPASPNIRPQASNQWALSYLKYFEGPKMEISAAAYHKQMTNQIDFEGKAITYLNPELEGELRFGTMRSYGLELLVKKDFGRLQGWLGYTYSRVFRTTNGLNSGREYPAFQDRPHDFSFLLHYQLARRIQCSAYFTAFSGSPFSSPTSFIQFNDQNVPIYGNRNNDRLPAYRRLDFSAKFTLNKSPEKKYQHSLTLSVNNILLHKNTFAVRFNRIPGIEDPFVVKSNVLSETETTPTQISLVQFLPSLTYRFKL